MIIDGVANVKNLTIFDLADTKRDLLDLMLYAHKRLLKRKLRVYI